MKYLKIFESVNDADKDVVIFRLAKLVISQEKYSALEGGLTHPGVYLAFEEFDVKRLLSLLFNGIDNLTMAINAVFDEFLKGNIDAHVDFDLNVTNVPNLDNLSWRTAAEFLKYCDGDGDIKNQLTNWEDVLKTASTKRYHI
jgi:hypothetical protein